MIEGFGTDAPLWVPTGGPASVTVTLTNGGGQSVSATQQLPNVDTCDAFSFSRVDLNNPPGSQIGSGANAVAVADLNGDGKPDVIAAGAGGLNSVSVYLNGGNGSSFLPPVTYPTGAGPVAIAIGDFNGDGRPDLAVVNQADSTVSILLNAGDGGTVLGQVAYPVGSGPIAIAVGDFNHDGSPDLAVANYNTNTISILINSGDGGTFLPHVDQPSGDLPTNIVAADFNLDGALDLATFNRGDSTVGVFFNRGDGTFRAQAAYPAGQAMNQNPLFAADLNDDGAPDLLVQSGLLLNSGDGGSFTLVTAPWPISVDSFALGDFASDGGSRLLGVDDGVSIEAYAADADAGTAGERVIQRFPVASLLIQDIASGDFNGDGKLDFAVSGSIYQTDTAGEFDGGVIVFLNNSCP